MQDMTSVQKIPTSASAGTSPDHGYSSCVRHYRPLRNQGIQKERKKWLRDSRKATTLRRSLRTKLTHQGYCKKSSNTFRQGTCYMPLSSRAVILGTRLRLRNAPLLRARRAARITISIVIEAQRQRRRAAKDISMVISRCHCCISTQHGALMISRTDKRRLCCRGLRFASSSRLERLWRET